MARRKVTFVYDPAARTLPLERDIRSLHGVDSLSVTVEDLPDPPVHQRFIVEYFGRPGVGPIRESAVRARLREEVFQDGTWAITEVPDA